MLVNMEGIISHILDHKRLEAGWWIVEFILSTPAFEKDGKVIAKEQHYTVQVWGKEEDHVSSIRTYFEKKVKIECWLNGIKSEKDGKLFFTNKLNLKNLQAI